ncbi:hypothetical protein E2C01_069647 [Portunus trituberculatus]|uniref:Uncharacterized protein n=1 Tax=Portunus trituberculatus TaxID=210409 RepID=A0A5B7HV38_PORTR|nr:hypothetical protein [Portunus trituberculatus]
MYSRPLSASLAPLGSVVRRSPEACHRQHLRDCIRKTSWGLILVTLNTL